MRNQKSGKRDLRAHQERSQISPAPYHFPNLRRATQHRMARLQGKKIRGAPWPPSGCPAITGTHQGNFRYPNFRDYHFFTQGPNHLITSSSHTGRTTRSPLSLSPPLPPLSVAAVAVVVATIAVVTVVARAVATVAAAVATVAVAADAVAAFTVAVATAAAAEWEPT